MAKVSAANTLYHLIEYIITTLLKKDYTRLDLILEGFLEQNYMLGGIKEGFLLEGKFHTLLPSKQQFVIEKRMLHPRLHGEVREYLAERRLIEVEAKTIQQGLSLLVKPCKSTQDLRDALPEDIVDLVPQFRSMTRQRPEAWCLEGSEFQKHQYGTVKEKLMFYITNQMLY
jgi:hypothetical protein